jgi:hypothetical protein
MGQRSYAITPLSLQNLPPRLPTKSEKELAGRLYIDFRLLTFCREKQRRNAALNVEQACQWSSNASGAQLTY